MDFYKSLMIKEIRIEQRSKKKLDKVKSLFA